MSKLSVDDAIDELNNAKGNFQCARLIEILESFGFVVASKRSKHHKVVKHLQLPNFLGSNFACEHGKNPNVKKVYVGKVKRILTLYKDDLELLK